MTNKENKYYLIDTIYTLLCYGQLRRRKKLAQEGKRKAVGTQEKFQAWSWCSNSNPVVYPRRPQEIDGPTCIEMYYVPCPCSKHFIAIFLDNSHNNPREIPLSSFDS